MVYRRYKLFQAQESTIHVFAIGVGESPEEKRYLKDVSSYRQFTTPLPNATFGITDSAHAQSFSDIHGQERLNEIVDKIVATLCEGIQVTSVHYNMSSNT